MFCLDLNANLIQLPTSNKHDYSTISDSSLGHLAFHGSFSPSKTANQSLPVYEKRKFPSKTGRLLQELYKITK